MIKVENISKSIRSKLLFKNISFDLPNNKIIGLLGANGAGKTSVFKAISGLSKIDSGKIKFYDENLHLMTLEERSNAGLNYVPQENSLFDDLSLQENLEAIIELRFKEISSDKSKQIENLLDLMKLTDKANTKSKFLSGGEKRKTEILRAILLDSKFILLDEPFAGVDPIAVEDIQSIISVLKRKNIGILITDHNVQETLAITDRTYLMFEGKILKEGIPEDLAKDEMVRKVYLGKNFEFKRKKI